MYGSSVYPDATFTLRLAFGEAKGYTEDGQKIPWATTLGGTYEHAAEHNNKDPFELPKIWNERKSQLNLSTPFNFVSTADIIGGNSGSPVINRQGELVGIFSTAILNLWCWITFTPTRRPAPSPCIRPGFWKRCERFTRPIGWSRNLQERNRIGATDTTLTRMRKIKRPDGLPSGLFTHGLEPLIRERQIGPKITQVAWGGAIGIIVALPAEDRDIAKRIRGPYCSSAACADHIVYEGYAICQISSVLVGIADSLPPNPLSGAVLIFPDVVHEASWVRGRGTISPTAEEPEVAVGIAPADGTPTRTGNVCCRAGASVVCSLSAICAGLIRGVAP